MALKLDSVMAEKQEVEQFLGEITLKLDSITAELERSRFEKDIDSAKRNIEKPSEEYIELIDEVMAAVKKEDVPLEILNKFSDLREDVENKNKYLLSVLTSQYYSTGEATNNALSKSISSIANEANTFYSDIREKVIDATIDLVRFIVQEQKRCFEELSQQLRSTVVQVSEQSMELCNRMHGTAKHVRAGKDVFQEIEDIRSIINTKESFLIQETFALTVSEKQGANGKSKEEASHRIGNEVMDYLQEVVNKIKHVYSTIQILSDAKNRWQKNLYSTLSLTAIVVIWGVQVLTQLVSKKISSDPVQVTAWLIVYTLSATLFTFLGVFYANLIIYYAKQIDKRKGLFVALLFYATIMILFWLLLFYVTYAILPNWLFIVVFPICKFVSGTNPALTIIQNMVAIVAFTTLLLWSFKVMKKQADKIFEG